MYHSIWGYWILVSKLASKDYFICCMFPVYGILSQKKLACYRLACIKIKFLELTICTHQWRIENFPKEGDHKLRL